MFQVSNTGGVSREVVTAGSHQDHVLRVARNPGDFPRLTSEVQVVASLLSDIVAAGLAPKIQESYATQWNHFMQ